MNHYVLQCHGKKSSWAEPAHHDDDMQSWQWLTGKPLENGPSGPIDLVWDPESGERLSYYMGNPHLMSRALVDALHDAGVTTLEVFDTVVRSSRGKPDCTDYLAVNVVSVVEAADMEASETVDLGLGQPDFESLVIDEEKAAGHKLFRLAECVSALIVAQSVVTHLEGLGGFGLTFLDPEDFCG